MKHNKRIMFAIGIMLMFALSVPTVFGQSSDSDGDGLPDSVDNCPNEPGPRENDGCPVEEEPSPDRDNDTVPDEADECPDAPGSPSNAGCPSAGDTDQDGITDDVDFCPNDPGPAENGGCPVVDDFLPIEDGQPDFELQPLPGLDPTGPCEMAPNGYYAVNLRQWPDEVAPIVGTMGMYEIKPVYYFFEDLQDRFWAGTSPGLAADWVVRRAGQCRGLPQYSWATDDNDGLKLSQVSMIELPTDIAGFNPQPEPPPEFLPEDFPFPEPREQMQSRILLGRFGEPMEGEDEPPMPMLVGLLLPAVQSARDAAAETGETHYVVLIVPGTWEGFNPQPDPPGDDEYQPVFIVPGDLVGFNPQPEPPPTDPYFQLTIKIEPFESSNENAEDTYTIPVEMVSLNFGAIEFQACDGSVMPTGDTACLYTNELGQTAVCFTGSDGGIGEMSGSDGGLGDTAAEDGAIYCMYGYPSMAG
ncbi:MAG: hypothetical protein GYB65_06780 [Chloroflexi bacterium]|nr:hypothetical protein [Chloroflexota bacterium]